MFTTNYTFKELLNFQLRDVSITNIGSNWYIGLSTTTITFNGENITELSGYGYSRQLYNRNEEAWSIPNNGETHNLFPISFNLTAVGDTYIKSIFISNSLNSTASNNIYYVSNLDPFIHVGKYSNYNLMLPIGSIKIKRSNKIGEYYASN